MGSDSNQLSNALVDNYKKLNAEHRAALCWRMARVTLGSSVVRVFKPGTKVDLLNALAGLPIDELLDVGGDDDFKSWFERQLGVVTKAIKKKNEKNPRIQPGTKWGHATKVLTIYLREMVSHTRYFNDSDAKRIEALLYCPIDRITIESLARVGHRPRSFKRIKEIDTSAKFYGVQDLLGDAAKATNTPRVWFDDGWGDRDGE